MKNNQCSEIMLPVFISEACGFDGADTLALHTGEDTLVILKNEMSAIELVHAISGLSEMTSELTVALAKACGLCDNCAEDDETGVKDPAEWVERCSICQDLLDSSMNIRVPGYLMEEAGISPTAKLEAYADGETGEITVTEAENEFDISDVPPDLLTVLQISGICLAKLDELIMQGEAVYKK